MKRSTIAASVTRRRFLAGTAGAAALGLLAACGDSDDTAGGGEGSSGAAEEPAEREVETDKGPVTVPARAERVACADFYGAFTVVDLGLVPVAASGSGYEDTGPTYAPKLAKVPLVGDFTVPDPELVADTEPDLILRTIDTDDALYGQLTDIAPTVVISFQQLSLTEVATKVGDVLGRADEAATLLADYESACEDIRTRHAEVLGKYTFTFAQLATDTTFWTLGEKWTDTKVMVDCGITLAEPSASQAEATEEYSMERIPVLADSDVLFVPSDPDGVTEGADQKPMTGSALWAQLPAAKAGRVFPVLSGAASIGTALELVDRLDTVLGELAKS